MEIDNQTYLMFRHSDALYGVEAHRVREIFQLPELTLIADAPKDIMGSLNWRGKLLPVMHLDLRLGLPLQPCQLSDTVIVMEWQGIQVGLVVQQVLDVQSVTPAAQESAPDYGRSHQINTAFVAGIAKVGSELAVLLNPETLIRQPDEVAMLIWEAELDALPEDSQGTDIVLETEWQAHVVAGHSGANFYDRYCAAITPAEQALFRQRADELRPPLADTEQTDHLPLAVIGLDEDYFALELDKVREFINVQHVTPIPCCPSHIVGNINLRGEVMTLVDIRTALQKTPSTAVSAKAIVVEVDDVVAGIPVDAVLDVMYLPRTGITEVPMATSQQDYFQGFASYRDQHLRILDLPTLFAAGGLAVDQGG
ncbi:chemotaxis protein CheW [Acaryochloris sp. IP29b_bin.148]|uniref:chemotaxis protein CheW n=1 Tax=Acaryochloris sp. IP29b_bin.148 TaxID=2969218 RepID=UPI00261AE1C9|nr:chemotaxis protein CheW [Acaryochloris sp. IP29b_bin.148]